MVKTYRVNYKVYQTKGTVDGHVYVRASDTLKAKAFGKYKAHREVNQPSHTYSIGIVNCEELTNEL
jgi:hypothetical protein